MLYFSSSYKEPLETVQCIREFGFKPYHYLSDYIAPERIFSFFFEELNRFQNKKDHYLLIAKKDDKIAGICALLISEWDSKLFGFNYGIIKYIIADGDYHESLSIKNRMIDFILNWCREKGIRFFHSRVDTTDISSIQCLKQNRFKPVTNVVRYAVSAKQIRLLNRMSPYVRLCRDDDIERIKEISKFIFINNRFFLDSNFNREAIQKLYAGWAENSCKGQVQDKVFVYQRDKEIAGFAACGLRRRDSELLLKRIGAIDLVGVDPVYHNRGIGVKMVHYAIERLRENTDVAEAVMASHNDAMIKILNRFGFILKSVQTDFHWWDNRGDTTGGRKAKS